MLETIKSSREIDRLFECGKRASNVYVSVLAAPTSHRRDPLGRVAIVAGKKIGNAVLRSRAKRVLRESTRRLNGPWANQDVVLIARKRTATATMNELDTAIEDALRRAGVLE